MTTKVYVAGASSEIERAEAVIAKLEELGIEVTSTWPKVIRRAAGSGAPAVGANPAHWTKSQREPVAMQDLAEVDAADVLLVLQPGPGKKTEGAFCELGFAKARYKFILWSQGGEAIAASIFTGVADEWLLSDNSAIARVSRYSAGRAMIQAAADPYDCSGPHGGGMAGHDED